MFVTCPICLGSRKVKKAEEWLSCPCCGGSGFVPEREALELALDREYIADLPEGLAK